jgi:oligopeptide/dipeptide ABC transporter ATP-binding protein
MADPLLAIDDLTVELPVEGEMRTVLRGITLSIAAGSALGLVGESGSGKSMTARSIARLLPPGATCRGAIRFGGEDVLAMSGRALRNLHEQVAVVFQDPRAHVNPVRRIGDYMTEALRTLHGMSKADAAAKAVQRLADVGIVDGARRLEQYPHELSGGLLQRVMIAAALLTDPRLLLADEPTTALDVTTQAEVMAILDELRHERGLAMLFITHDLDLASAVCDQMVVMYAGEVVEEQRAEAIQDHGAHPYTQALVAARPDVNVTASRLRAVPGRPLSAFEAPTGCAFAPRCDRVVDRCRVEHPELVVFSGGRARCLLLEVNGGNDG